MKDNVQVLQAEVGAHSRVKEAELLQSQNKPHVVDGNEQQRETEEGAKKSGQTGGTGDGHNGKGPEVRTDRNHEDELIVEELK